jgi:hypothetical protein
MAMNINLRSGTVWNPAVWQIVNSNAESYSLHLQDEEGEDGGQTMASHLTRAQS